MSLQNHGGRPGGLAGTFRTLSGLLAVCAAVLLGPSVWSLIDGTAWRGLSRLYDHETATWLHLGAEALSYLAVFLVTRAVCTGVFLAASLALAKRLI